LKMKNEEQEKNQTGQAALIALLVLTIATTVGLALIARNTTSIATTRTVADSARAFAAAEAGVEEALQSGVGSSATVDTTTGAKYTSTVTTVSGSSTQPLVFPQKTLPEDTETVWLVNHNADGSLTQTPTYTSSAIDVCWSSETTTPAVVVTVLYKSSADGSYRVAKGAYDPDSTRASADKFATPTAMSGGCGVGTNTTYDETVPFANFTPPINPTQDTLLALRIRPVYSLAQIAVKPRQPLVSQGSEITSVGSVANSVDRKILVIAPYRAPSTIFDAAVFSVQSFQH